MTGREGAVSRAVATATGASHCCRKPGIGAAMAPSRVQQHGSPSAGMLSLSSSSTSLKPLNNTLITLATKPSSLTCLQAPSGISADEVG